MCRHICIWVVAVLAAVAAMFVSSPVLAGHWELRYTPNAAISIKKVGDRIVGIVNPTFVPGRAGEIELRLAGVPFAKLSAPPYEFGIDPTRPVTPLSGEEYKGFGAVSIRDSLDYTIEAYVVESKNRKQSAVPALTFRLEKTDAMQSAVTGLSEGQLKELLKKAYNEGLKTGQLTPEVGATAQSVQTGRIVVRLWDEKGFLAKGKVMIRSRTGERLLDVDGRAGLEVPAGQVEILVPKGQGWRFESGQKAEVNLASGGWVFWDLVKGGAR